MIPQKGCEEGSGTEKVHERVTCAHKWRISAQQPWRCRRIPSSQEGRLSLRHLNRMHMTAPAPPSPVPQVQDGHVPITVGLLKKDPGAPFHSSAPSICLSAPCWCLFGTDVTRIESDRSERRLIHNQYTHSETCTADQHVSVSPITVETNSLKMSAFVLNSFSHPSDFIGCSSWF